MNKFYVFDVETKPVPEAVTRYGRPFAEFDEAAVKCGNLRDPAKIAEKKAQARDDHEAERLAYWKNLHDRAALDPFTGEVLCVGLCSYKGEPEIIAETTEQATLRQFWNIIALAENAVSKFCFWSGCGDPMRKFDLDFLVTRSRILHIPLPARVREGRYYANRFVDLASEFLLCQRERYLSLTKAAEMFGLFADHKDVWPKSDSDPVTGENFHLWWGGKAVDPLAIVPTELQRGFASGYLKNDLLLTRYLAPHILQ